MFNFFGSKDDKTPIQKDDVLASITYLIKKDDSGGGALIDVELKDYDDESIDALSELLDILGDDSSYIETINIIKSSFVEKQRFDLLVKVFANIQNKVKLKLANMSSPKGDKPCVKPSEIWSNINFENRG